MRTLAVAAKTAREQLRTPLVPLLAIGFGAFFVLLIGLFFPSGGSTTFRVAVTNADEGAHGEAVVRALSHVTYGTGSGVLEVQQVADPAAARALVQDREAVVFVELGRDFSQAVGEAGKGTSQVPLTIGGDLGTPAYPVAAILVTGAIDDYLRTVTGRPALLALEEVALGNSASRSEFDLYVPGVLVFAIGLMIFSAAMVLAQEVESGTVNRLVRTPAGAGSVLGGITLVQLALGLLAGLAALGTAALLGFRSAGPLWLALPVWLLTGLSVVGLGLLVASITRSVAQAFLVANFPFGVFMFLSGTVFPVRGVPLFSIAGQEVNLLDVLPQRHAVNALTAVFGYGSTDIGYELGMLALLSAGFFALGVWAFGRRHLRVAH
jgi:ABC-2 type transport system permease protein